MIAYRDKFCTPGPKIIEPYVFLKPVKKQNVGQHSMVLGVLQNSWFGNFSLMDNWVFPAIRFANIPKKMQVHGAFGKIASSIIQLVEIVCCCETLCLKSVIQTNYSTQLLNLPNFLKMQVHKAFGKIAGSTTLAS